MPWTFIPQCAALRFASQKVGQHQVHWSASQGEAAGTTGPLWAEEAETSCWPDCWQLQELAAALPAPTAPSSTERSLSITVSRAVCWPYGHTTRNTQHVWFSNLTCCSCRGRDGLPDEGETSKRRDR